MIYLFLYLTYSIFIFFAIRYTHRLPNIEPSTFMDGIFLSITPIINILILIVIIKELYENMKTRPHPILEKLNKWYSGR